MMEEPLMACAMAGQKLHDALVSQVLVGGSSIHECHVWGLHC